MKKRLFSIFLGVCLLAACGSSALEDPRNAAPEPPETETESAIEVEAAAYAFQSRVFDLPNEMRGASQFTAAANRIFVAVPDVRPLMVRLHSVDLYGEDLTSAEVGLSGDDVSIIGPRRGKDGALWLLAQTFDVTETETGGRELTRDLVLLIRLDDAGDVQETIQMTDAPGGIRDMEADGAGNIYLLAASEDGDIVVVYDPNTRTHLGETALEGWDDALVRVGELVYLGGWGQAVQAVEVLSGGVILGPRFPLYTHGRTWPGLDGRVYFSGEETLFSQAPNRSPARAELDWSGVDIAPHAVRGLFTLEDGTLLAHLLGDQMAVLTRIDPDAVPERTKLTLATMSPGADLEEAVARFNRATETYRIVIRDYNQYNDADGWAEGFRRLQEDLVSDAAPDVVDLTGLQTELLAGQGALRDLFPFIDADDGFARSDFQPHIMDTLTRGGALYELPNFFYVIIPVDKGPSDEYMPEPLRVGGFEMRGLYAVLSGEDAPSERAFGLGRSLAIPARSANPEAAWVFLRQRIEQRPAWGFSMLQVGLGAQIEAALLSRETETWGLGGVMIEVGPIDQTDVDWTLALIAGTQTVARLDELWYNGEQS